MSFDLSAAERFLATHGRLLDRRRLRVAVAGSADAGTAALEALEGYGNPDGGYGWGIEPDLRAPESQPVGGLHAFEVFEEAAAVGVTSPRAALLCDFLATVTVADGGLPFAVPIADPAGCAPFWAGADPTVSSLQITAAVTGAALRTARHDPSVAAHPWLVGATAFCLGTVADRQQRLTAYETLFALGVLDALADRDDALGRAACVQLDRIGADIPPSGVLRVVGGTDGEAIRPIQLAPFPDRPVRRLFTPEVIAADLERFAAGQQDDGGWTVDYDSYSPAAALEWRGYATVSAVQILMAANS